MSAPKCPITICAAALAASLACSSPEGTEAQSMGAPAVLLPSAAPTVDMQATADPSAMASAPGAVPPPAPADGSEGLIMDAETAPTAEPAMECASTSTGTSLEGVVLAFAFDDSGSMGSHSQPYFAREFKWDPVVQATKAFFSDPASLGVSATMTFFPNELAPLVGGGGGNEGDACNAADYGDPDVPLTALPSEAFAMAIDAITPAADGDWRQGTPTGPALEGVITSVQALRAAEPNTNYVIVLVTDGEPAMCSAEQNDIDYVSGVVAAVADEIPTYVIGIGNPVTEEFPNPPTEGIENLHALAAAGGTGEALLIDTNDPVQTAADFRAVIDAIREDSFNCTVQIPEAPPGQTFDSTKVNVNYESSSTQTALVYDPTCTDPAGWYYDDAENPSVILLCDAACSLIQNDAVSEGQLDVEFGCETRTSGAR